MSCQLPGAEFERRRETNHISCFDPQVAASSNEILGALRINRRRGRHRWRSAQSRARLEVQGIRQNEAKGKTSRWQLKSSKLRFADAAEISAETTIVDGFGCIV